MSFAGISVAVKFVFKKNVSSPLFDTSKLVDKFKTKRYFSMISGGLGIEAGLKVLIL